LFSAGRTIQSAADELFTLVAERAIREQISCTYALRDAAMAHRDIERRTTIGSVLLP
jgi:NADPH:quinone reductase